MQRNVRWGAYIILVTVGAVHSLTAGTSEEPSSEALISKAGAAYARGHRDEAMLLASQAIAAAPTDPRGYLVRARIYADAHRSTNAIADYDNVLKLEPQMAEAWQRRGAEQFKLGHVNQSLADFDRFVALAPSQAPYLWQRGISCYYAGRFDEGRKQFELHQTVNPNDVENAVWHFLCVARSEGIEKARAALIPIKGDARVPMMEIYALFGGKTKPESVLTAASAAAGEGDRAMFYAHLYLGLYCEATGEKKRSSEHIAKAAGQYRTDDYMGEVARVHQLLRTSGETPASAEPKAH
jgi:lipoprotein NlpI